MLTLRFLGTGAALPTAHRYPTSVLVACGHERFLVDCGEGAQLRLLQLGESLTVPHIFLTHDHFDHILGLGGLLYSLDLMGMEDGGVCEVTVHGPPTTLESVRTLVSMMHPTPEVPVGVQINWAPADPGLLLDTGHVLVSAFRTNHRDDRDCYGYVIECTAPGGGKVVFTGDSGYLPALVDLSRGADFLISEATYKTDHEAWARKVGHLTAAQAARLAAESGVKELLLTHLSAHYADSMEEVLAEARVIFPASRLVHDLDLVTAGS